MDTHIKYIEASLIRLAKELDNVELENRKLPTLNSLPEADVSDMEGYINQIKVILPTMGYNIFIANAVVEKEEEESTSSSNTVFYIKGKKAKARMVEKDGGFVVLKDSQAVNSVVNSMGDGWKRLRNRLIDSKVLISSENHYVFDKDTKFNSTSAASAHIG